jgi:hypothetical protein
LKIEMDGIHNCVYRVPNVNEKYCAGLDIQLNVPELMHLKCAILASDCYTGRFIKMSCKAPGDQVRRKKLH